MVDHRPSRILLVGEVVVDVTASATGAISMRLGGILHACRALWALEVEYDLAYLAPDYLQADIEEYVAHHGARSCRRIAKVLGAPNVFYINDAQEVGDQGYEYLLRDRADYEFCTEEVRRLLPSDVTDALLLPASFPLDQILRKIANSDVTLHVDIANFDDGIAPFAVCKIGTLTTSTSSVAFTESASQPDVFLSGLLTSGAELVVLKENRGGARAVSSDGAKFEIGAQLRSITHSVGVGDVFNAALVVALSERKTTHKLALAYSSWIAAAYAETKYPDDFHVEVQRIRRMPVQDLLSIPGVRLPWERRSELHIYIAAPDFDYMDDTVISAVESALKYHNFQTHRPVQEFGQANAQMTDRERAMLGDQDLELLVRCDLVVAILDYEDVGTSIELGFAASRGIPTVALCTTGRLLSPMVLAVVNSVVKTMDDLLVHVFQRLETKVNVT